MAATFKRQFLAALIPRLAQIGFTFAQPYLIRRTVILLAVQGPNAKARGVALTAAYAIVYIGIGVRWLGHVLLRTRVLSLTYYISQISTAQAQHKTNRLISSMRGTMVTMVYNKAIQMPEYKGEDVSAITAMHTDVNRVMAGFTHIHDLWASLIELPLCLWLLWHQLSTADVAPILIFLGKLSVHRYLKHDGG